MRVYIAGSSPCPIHHFLLYCFRFLFGRCLVSSCLFLVGTVLLSPRFLLRLVQRMMISQMFLMIYYYVLVHWSLFFFARGAVTSIRLFQFYLQWLIIDTWYIFSSCFFLFSIPFVIFALLFFSPSSINSRNSDPASQSRLFTPPPHYDGACLVFLSREDSSSFSPPRLASNCACPRHVRVGALSSWSFLFLS